MRKFYQTDWFGIYFKSFININSRKIAGISFYNKFYEEFYKKFSSYEDLPHEWLLNKNLIADFILKQTNNIDRVLSIGSGIGYIEYNIKNAGRNIVAIEPSQKASEFIKKFSNIKIYNGFPSLCLNEKEGMLLYDFIYMVAVDYIFNNNELISLLKNIKNFKAKNFLLISVSIYKSQSLSQTFKHFIKLIMSFFNFYELGQLWGYERKSEDFLYIFRKTGFVNIKSGFLKENIFWIKGD